VNRLAGKFAIVTGAASGIGRAIAERLAAEGGRVVVADVSPAGQAVAQAIGGLFLPVDLASRAGCARLVGDAIAACGTIHILVNNAGIQHVASIEAFPDEAWDRLLAVMLTAPFALARAAWPAMTAQGWGRIVNISSLNALRAEPQKAAYNAAKAGLLGLTRTLAVEGGPHGITAHAILPGLVRTPLIERQLPALAAAYGVPAERVAPDVLLRAAPIKRFIEPAEIAALVAFLCSDEAAAMTGTPILMDQGIHASI
jgi:3-hydroxybutyrate dehydrogenase